MQGYDAALKLLLQASSGSIMQQLTGLKVERWLSSEVPKVHTSRADLLGAAADGRLVHIELQSSNDADMALRMAEYALGIYRKFRKYPQQTVLYVGEPKMRMKAHWREPASGAAGLVFRYHLLDIRQLDGVSMLNSSRIEENLLSILTRLPDARSQIREVLSRIARLEDPARRDALAQFLIISGLRRLAPVVEEESRKMPILNDILDHEVIGPAILQGRREGREEGRQEGIREASHKALRLLLEQRFGALPQWVTNRLADSSVPQLDEMMVRFLHAATLEDLFADPANQPR